jgi:hypothetical protein
MPQLPHPVPAFVPQSSAVPILLELADAAQVDIAGHPVAGAAMSVDMLLARLEGVKGRDGSWRARCPVHGSKSVTLAVRELPDGRVLLKCHAQCSTEDVLVKIGLDWQDLFPQRLADRLPRVKKPWRIGDVIRALKFELTLAIVAVSDLLAGKEISDIDRERARVACDRICRFLRELDNAG